ncbi:hypothetical protein O7632_25355 [Solwaraspora sp. WMMD406]|uniref:hypothetical protein n=1 Tax=Solwaraspora sp. WMMD406 TaxID=3016095 RepID=UPI0024167459|nr:hypothetical protein [Solwaraspora sp. WMMD406]MDG4767392.1 hypothetical protein [Solwaraspora sp. WMMD406]
MSDDVAEPVKERAAAVGKSPSAYVARQPIKITECSTNAEIVQRLKIVDGHSGQACRVEVRNRVAGSLCPTIGSRVR